METNPIAVAISIDQAAKRRQVPLAWRKELTIRLAASGLETGQISHHKAVVDVDAIPAIVSVGGLVYHIPRPLAIAVAGRLPRQRLAHTLYSHRFDAAQVTFAYPADGKVSLYEAGVVARHPAI